MGRGKTGNKYTLFEVKRIMFFFNLSFTTARPEWQIF